MTIKIYKFINAESGNDDKRLKVSADDTAPGFLEAKLTVAETTNSTNILELTTLNNGSNEIRQIGVDETKIDHDQLTNFISNEHIDHSNVDIATGVDSGLAGGGDITTTRNLEVDISGTTEETVIANNDEILIEDVSASAKRKITRSNFLDTYVASSSIPSTDNAVARFDSTTGELIEDSLVTIGDSGTMSTPTDLVVYAGSSKEFEVGDELFEVISTGVYEFSGLSINAGDSTLFDVGITDGHIVDFANDAYYNIDFLGSTGETPLTSNGVTYVFIDNTGSVSLQTTAPSSSDRRNKIYLGRIVTISGVVVQVLDEPSVILNATNQIYDLGKAIRIFNIDGNQISPNGSNLNIDKSAGSLFSIGANFTTNPDQPHKVDINADSPATFAYITRSPGSTGSDTTTIIPGSYDNSGTITAIPGAGRQATIQRIYLFPSGNLRIAYGQAIYSDISSALQAINNENFIINPNIPGNGVLIGLLVLRKDTTNLSDSQQARFLEVSRFGESSVGAAGQSVSTLQNAYTNSIFGDITLDSTRGSFEIKDASTPIGATLFEVTNNAKSAVFFDVDANGAFSTRMDVDNLRLDGNVISSTDVNGNITLTPNGTGSVIISSDLVVQGDTTTLNTSTLEVEDANITVNNGGDQTSADTNDAGITVEMSDATDAIIHYDSTSSTSWKVGVVGDVSDIADIDTAQTLENKTLDGTSATGNNTISIDAENATYDNGTSGLTATDVQAAIDEIDEKINPRSEGDISETSFSMSNNVTTPTTVTGFAFLNATVRSFSALVSVEIDADTDLFEVFEITGIQKSTDWSISVSGNGDDSLVSFTINSSGQLQYTSGNYTGFISGFIKFRAQTTTV